MVLLLQLNATVDFEFCKVCVMAPISLHDVILYNGRVFVCFKDADTKKPQEIILWRTKGLNEQAWVGIEPTMKLLQSLALPLGYHAEN